jgi:hypothetical protein
MLALPPSGDTATGRCVSFRLWIVPAIATVHPTKTRLYVLSAPLKVKMARVYMSRVAAQWVREQARPHTALSRLVDSELHRSWAAHPSWSPDAIWEHYLQQFDVVPTAYTMPVQAGGTTVNVTVYASGGVDLRHKIRENRTSNRQFKAHWPGLATAAKRPATADGTILVGGGTTMRRVSHGRRPHPMRVPRSVVAATGL